MDFPNVFFVVGCDIVKLVGGGGYVVGERKLTSSSFCWMLLDYEVREIPLRAKRFN